MNGMDSGKELKDSSNSPGVMDLSLRPLQVCWRKKKRVAEEFGWKILEACVGEFGLLEGIKEGMPPGDAKRLRESKAILFSGYFSS